MTTPLSGAPCKQPGTAAAIRRHLSAGNGPATLPYPETVNLPFNRRALPDGFTLYPAARPAPQGQSWWLLLQGGSVILRESPEGLTLPSGFLPDWCDTGCAPLHFGALDGLPVTALTLPASQPLPDGCTAEPFNAFQERIPADLMTVAGIAKHLLYWQSISRYCSRCGAALEPLTDSWGKRCGGCDNEQYPPNHPCAIVLIRRGDQLLLIRKPQWPKGRYSLVAGFLDVGESLEECAIREAREETGVTIGNVRYVASQAWPFPAQIMVGFVADYISGDITVDGVEIDDARWFSIGHLPDLPARRSIARHLLDTFGGS